MDIKDVCIQLPFFEQLSQNDKELVLKYGRINNFLKGNSLINNNNECVGLVLILGGKLRAYTVSPEGKEITLYRLIDGDTCIMSAGCMLREITFEISFMFEEATTILIVPANIYTELNEKYNHVKSYTLDLVNGRFSDVMWVLEQFVFTKLATRLAGLLLEHSAYSQDDTIHVTHEDLARDLGTAREVITRVLKEFEQEKLIKLYRGRIELLDIARLNKT